MILNETQVHKLAFLHRSDLLTFEESLKLASYGTEFEGVRDLIDMVSEDAWDWVNNYDIVIDLRELIKDIEFKKPEGKDDK